MNWLDASCILAVILTSDKYNFFLCVRVYLLLIFTSHTSFNLHLSSFSLLYVIKLVYGVHFQGHGVVLVNTDDAGMLIVTNFRVIFLVSSYMY